MPTVILCLVIYIYVNQSCFIRWNSVVSNSFRVRNGVRQGAILSPSLFSVYLDTLLRQLRKLGIGCHIGSSFLGAFGYADDVTLLSPTREGLQHILNVCEKFADTHLMLFSTDSNPTKSKTKCFFFSRTRSADSLGYDKLNGNNLPWVRSAKNLGNQLSTKLNVSPFSPETKTDILSKFFLTDSAKVWIL